jgi:hypothetical protein
MEIVPADAIGSTAVHAGAQRLAQAGRNDHLKRRQPVP